MSIKNNFIVVLRHNTQLGGDVRLARREFDTLAGKQGVPIASRRELGQFGLPEYFVKHIELAHAEFVAIYYEDIAPERIDIFLQRSAFAQEAFITAQNRTTLTTVAKALRVPVLIVNDLDRHALVALSQSYTLESEGVLGKAKTRRLEKTIELLLEPYRGHPSAASLKLRKAKKTTLSLSHDLHIYKAKFFPRMIRALFNIFAPTTRSTVIDPYCGSGTALLEAALLGHDVVGVDLDPICALISRAKVTPFLMAEDIRPRLSAFCRHCENSEVTDESLPSELVAKICRRDKIDGTAYLPEIKAQAAMVASAVRKIAEQSPGADLLRTIASDSVTKKVRYRFVGVGNGRYTIEIVKQPLLERLREKLERSDELCSVFPEIHRLFGTSIGPVSVGVGDARVPTSWPIRNDIDIIVTSPPYLPASSGREHYAASRALAFYVLGMQPGEHGYYDTAISPKGDGQLLALDKLPEAKRLMDYLASDESQDADPQRDAMRFERKAIPTHRYLTDIQRFFESAAGALKKDGLLILVVAHHHVFYSHRRGEIEHIVSGKSLYSELAEQVGLYLHEEIEMELLKSTISRAKPMAKGDYFESVLVFRQYPLEQRAQVTKGLSPAPARQVTPGAITAQAALSARTGSSHSPAKKSAKRSATKQPERLPDAEPQQSLSFE